MNSIRYPKSIFLVVIILILIVITYYVYNKLNITLEGANSQEEVDAYALAMDNIEDGAKSPSVTPEEDVDALTMKQKQKNLQQIVADFTQDIYNKVKFYITSKTSESEKKTAEIIRQIELDVKNIENSNMVDPKVLEQWNNLKNNLEKDIENLQETIELNTNSSVGIDLGSGINAKIRGIVNNYI